LGSGFDKALEEVSHEDDLYRTLCFGSHFRLSAYTQHGKQEGKPMTDRPENAEAVLAGGRFWCTESDFEKVDGVVEVISGYTGGRVANPTYEQVSAGGTGHVEAVKVVYDPAKVSYEQLLQVFWHHVDPTDAGGQFVDRGAQYRSVIFYATDSERQKAEASKQDLAAGGHFGKPIVTEILPLGPLPAEVPSGLLQEEPDPLPLLTHGSGRTSSWKSLGGSEKEYGSEVKTEMKPQTTDPAKTDVGKTAVVSGGGAQ
jgi:peptide methionine sulfoxide reductase msrA/msrB